MILRKLLYPQRIRCSFDLINFIYHTIFSRIWFFGNNNVNKVASSYCDKILIGITKRQDVTILKY
jgi:hypothetical protein